MPGKKGMKDDLPELARIWEMFDHGFRQIDVRREFECTTKAQMVQLLFKMNEARPEIRIKELLFEQRRIKFPSLRLEFLTKLFKNGGSDDEIRTRLLNGV
jgi:hypothetical protein